MFFGALGVLLVAKTYVRKKRREMAKRHPGDGQSPQDR